MFKKIKSILNNFFFDYESEPLRIFDHAKPKYISAGEDSLQANAIPDVIYF